MYRKYDSRNEQRFVTDVTEWTQAETIPKHDPDADINVIYRRTQAGHMMAGSSRMPQYGDFTNLLQYDQMLEAISAAESAFLDLPAEERKKYDNNPKKYYEDTLNSLRKDEENAAAIAEAQRIASEKDKAIASAVALIKDNNVSIE